MFNKLTVRLPDEPIYIPDENKWSVTDEFGAKCLIGEVVDRLAAYEDSGLSPEEVVEIKKYLNMWIEICKENNVSIVQFKKWAEAEQEKRLVVLPCKPDTKVYRLWVVSGRKPVIDEYYAGLRFLVDHLDKFGKTVFLTREEAEKALEGSE